MIQKIQTHAREGKEISGVVVQDAITNLLQRQKKDLLDEIEDFKQDIARQVELTKKAESDSLRNERTYHLMKDKKDMLLKELKEAQDEKIQLTLDKQNL